jgi:YidC/Oxa1 family membrane protein insertase
MTPQQQQPEDSRNTIIFLVCAFALMLSYWFFVERPQEQHARALQAQQRAAVQQQQQQALAAAGPATLSRDQALTASPRVQIRTPDLSGSINLKGAAIDDLFLTQYPQTTDKGSPPVELFRPIGTDHAYYTEVAWGGAEGMPGPDTPWQLVSGSVLSPGHPIELAYNSANGLTFRRHIEVDDKYMFKVTDTVTNPTSHPVKAQLGAAVVRQGLPSDLGKGNAFEGGIGVFPTEGTAPDKKQGYKDWKKKGSTVEAATGGWYGLTDKYWLGAVIPHNQASPVKGAFRYDAGTASDTYSAGYDDAPQTIAPGASIQKTVDIFAGAKQADLLNRYSKDDHIPNFKLAIDWGQWFWFITQPLFWLLQHIRTGVTAVFGNFAGSLGVSILLLTVVVRGAMFPLALQSYASMSKMKKVQPLVEEVRKKHADDPTKQQQEMMALYQREKINPVAGCLPMLATIPVFFALYKMLFVTIEMRQQPFLWLKDLAAKDPTTIFNLFGLLPYDPSHLPMIGAIFATTLHIGILPILYGLTTFLQMQMSPTSTDPTQQAMMKFMPFLFMAFLASVPVGLLVYYVWSNLITIGQQWFMMHKHGVENPIDSFFVRLRDRSVKSSRKAAG